ncbi:MAG TPA: hypothetical protein VKZ93_06600 [Arenibacter sp.]|nr:hypothetical protein [Arenibacter sp.]
MKRIWILVLIVLGFGLITYNVTLVDFENPLEGNSIIALIGIMASLCAIVLLLVYGISKRIQNKMEE